MIRPRPLACAALLALAPMLHAQAPTAPDPQQAPPEPDEQQQQQAEPKPELILRELIVVQSDRYDTTANNPLLIPTTLGVPFAHTGRAKRTTETGAYEHAPMPLGVLTFQGAFEEPVEVRLELTAARSETHAVWPKDALQRDDLVIWRSVREADAAQRAEPFAGRADWLEPLRESEDRLWIQSQDKYRKERFLLYDASFKFEPALTLSLEENETAYAISSRIPERVAPPITVMLRKTDRGWSADELASPWPKSQMPIATKLDASSTGDELDQALAPIHDLLAERGYNGREIELATGMIASAGLDKSAMSLVYVLPIGVIDERIRLQVKPQPDRVIRTAIVVLNNVDPDLGSWVNTLLDDLSSDRWVVRDRAQRQLLSLGKAAIKKVQQLKDSEDPEVAFRAQQILDAHDWKMNTSR